LCGYLICSLALASHRGIASHESCAFRGVLRGFAAVCRPVGAAAGAVAAGLISSNGGEPARHLLLISLGYLLCLDLHISTHKKNDDRSRDKEKYLFESQIPPRIGGQAGGRAYVRCAVFSAVGASAASRTRPWASYWLEGVWRALRSRKRRLRSVAVMGWSPISGRPILTFVAAATFVALGGFVAGVSLLFVAGIAGTFVASGIGVCLTAALAICCRLCSAATSAKAGQG